jgi:hypothetical protein
MLFALILQGALLLGGQAPDQQAEVEKLFAEGAAFYKAGKYRPAIEKFEIAYALFPEPNLLYNIGRAHEALGEIDQAILKYNLCLSNPRSTDELKQKAGQKLAVLSAARAQGAAAAPTAPASTPTTPSAPAPVEEPNPTAPAPAPVAPPVAGAAGRGLPLAGLAGGVAAGVGVLGAAAGGVFYAFGVGTHDDLQAALEPGAGGVASVTRVEAEAQSQQGTDQKTIGVALLGVGGALVVGGGALLTMQLLGGE